MSDDDQQRKATRRERALKHPKRVAILELLSRSNGNGLTAAEVRDELPDSPPLSEIAYHLLVMVEPELVAVDGGRYRLP